MVAMWRLAMWRLCGGPLHGNSSVSLYEMVREVLIQRRGEQHLFPEIRSKITVGLGNGIRSGPGKVAQGYAAAPGRGAAVVSSSHHQ